MSRDLVAAAPLLTAALTASALLGACTNVATPEGAPDGLAIALIDAGSPEEIGVLAFVNDARTTFTLLDVEVGLDRRAAENLIAYRDGPDGTSGTADDQRFHSIEEVDAISYVGRVALEKLLAWAEDGGWIDRDGDARDRAILALVNDAATTFTLLDVDVALDRRAAENIMAARPFADLAQLDAVSYVGTSALDKLAAYALANGYGGEPTDPADPPPDAPCAIISEYLEGSGNNNKAVEIYNCGASPLPLEQIGLCLVRNGDTTCSSHAIVGEGELAPEAVWTTCRTQDGTFNDPFIPLREACDHAVGGAAIFNGDDRLVLFHDLDGSGDFNDGDTQLDSFGDAAVQPIDSPWAETNLRRCDLTPNAPDVDAKFTRHPRTDMAHLGVAPPTDCAVEVETLGGQGDDCLDHASCEEGLRCYGRPNDGSGPYGKCQDPSSGGGGSDCDRYTPCGPGLICAGWTLWGEGTCNPEWMAGRFGGPLDSAIPESDGGLEESVVVYGLASVPVDIEVSVHIVHPRLTDLRVTLFDPNGDSAVLFDRTTELTEWSRSFVTNGISRDDQVNGRWTLQLEDLVSGETGTLESFNLFIVSRWD